MRTNSVSELFFLRITPTVITVDIKLLLLFPHSPLTLCGLRVIIVGLVPIVGHHTTPQHPNLLVILGSDHDRALLSKSYKFTNVW